MEQSTKDNGTSSQQEVNNISFSDLREQLFATIPLKDLCQDMSSFQLPTFIEGLKRFHEQEYYRARVYFETAIGVKRNNLILFTLSLTLCLLDEYDLARAYADQIDTACFDPGITPDTTDLDNLYLFIEKSELPELQTNDRDWITQKEVQRIMHERELSKHQEILLVKKVQILSILRELEPAEARHILSEISRKYVNDEIAAKYIME